MVKRCIILSSVYTEDSFNDEVQQDARLVREILVDHEITEIMIPCESGSSFAHKIINRFKKMHIDSNSICHIVLNTHGIPGECDLRLEVIVDLLQYLLACHVKISQISALMCDGMTPAENSFDKSMLTTFFSPVFIKRRHEASMQLLQKKLNTLVADAEQKFEIRGFNYAYSPSEDQEQVKKLLLGVDGEILEVHITANNLRDTCLNPIIDELIYINTCQTKGISIPESEHNRIADIFANALNYMKKKISISLDQQEHINNESECWPLFKAISDFSKVRMSDSAIFLLNYKSWLKSNKLFSSVRLQVFGEVSELYLKKEDELQVYSVLPP